MRLGHSLCIGVSLLVFFEMPFTGIIVSKSIIKISDLDIVLRLLLLLQDIRQRER